jgi:NADH-quinone oxidoreductase subunit E
VNELLSKYPDEVQQILAKYPPERKKSAVLPLLYLAQRTRNFLTRPDIEAVAELPGVSATDVDGVVGFYSLFHENGGGRYRLQVCNDLPCALRGADEFLKKLCENVGIRLGETTSDGLITIEAVTCLAGCHRAPMMQVQGDGEIAYHENLTVESTLALVDDLRRKAQTGQPS